MEAFIDLQLTLSRRLKRYLVVKMYLWMRVINNTHHYVIYVMHMTLASSLLA